MNDDDGVFYPGFGLGSFRWAVARYVKYLIRARWKFEPGFLTSEELSQWHLRNIQGDTCSAWSLLEKAAAELGRLNTDFLPRCGSGGVSPTDESTPGGRLVSTIAFLVAADGGGPSHNKVLLDAAVKLQKRRTIDWNALVRWESLSQIRADLNKLPGPKRAGDTDEQRAEFLGDGRYRVGDQPISLDGLQADVLQSLVEKRSTTQRQLVDASGVQDAPRVLKTIRRNFPQLAPFIGLPGRKNRGGYSTTIIDARH